MTVSLTQQIEELERELWLREGVYARQVAAGKMRASVAEFHLARLRAARDTLARLAARPVWAAEIARETDDA